jgi:hypothetical protein
VSRRKPSHAQSRHLHPVQFGQGTENRKRRVVMPQKHYKQGGNSR